MATSSSFIRGARRQIAIAALAIVCTAVGARAGVPSPCEQFHWPLIVEREWLADAEMPVFASGANVAELPTKAFALRLAPFASVTFAQPPERAPKADGTFAGVLSLPALPQGGVYQVTLSGEAWIDVIQEGRPLKSLEHSGRKDCPEIRKSVRFEIAAKPVTLQFSGAAGDTLKIAIRKAE